MMTFIQINLLLLLTYFLFSTAQKMGLLFKSKSSHRAFLICAQVLILLSLSAPFISKFIPEKQIPSGVFPVFQANETMEVEVTKFRVKKMIAEAPVEVQKLQDSFQFNFKLFFMILWAAGVFFSQENYFSIIFN